MPWGRAQADNPRSKDNMTEKNVEGAGPDEEDVVVIEDEAPEPAAKPEPKLEQPKRKPAIDGLDPEDADYGTKVQRRIGQLAKQRREAEARAEAAERALYEVRKNSLTQADASYKAQLEQAQDRQRRAFSEGDADAVAQTSADMAEIAARRAEVQREARQPAPPPQAQQQRFTERTQSYIDDNPWFTSDPDARDIAVAAHAAAERKGIKPDTDAYFDFVTSRVRAVHPEHFEDTEDVEVEQPRRSPAPPVAPARRTVPGMAAPKGKLPSLTAAEADFARKAGIDLRDYAQQKARLAAAGELGIRK